MIVSTIRTCSDEAQSGLNFVGEVLVAFNVLIDPPHKQIGA
jgi:hypothetical protein